MDRFVEQRVCCCSDEALSLCVLVNICRFTSAWPWWAQLNSRKQTTNRKFVWDLEAFTGYLLHHLESTFVLYAAAPLSFFGPLFVGRSASSAVEGSLYLTEFPYWANQFCLGSFIIFTEIFEFVNCCVSVRIMRENVIWCLEAWLSSSKRETWQVCTLFYVVCSVQWFFWTEISCWRNSY